MAQFWGCAFDVIGERVTLARLMTAKAWLSLFNWDEKGALESRSPGALSLRPDSCLQRARSFSFECQQQILVLPNHGV